MKLVLLALAGLMLPSCLVTPGDLAAQEERMVVAIERRNAGEITADELKGEIKAAIGVTVDTVEARAKAQLEAVKDGGMTLLMQLLGGGTLLGGAYTQRKRIGSAMTGSPPPAAPSA